MTFSLLKKIWKFLADFAGVISTIGLFIVVSKYLFKKLEILLSTHLIYGILLLILIFIAVIFLVLLAEEKLHKLINLTQKELVLEKISEIVKKSIPRDDFNIEDFIPKKSLLKQVLSIATKESLIWSHDSKLESYNFYLERTENKIRITIQIIFISDWKKEALTIYYPSMSKDKERQDTGEIYKDNYLFFNNKYWKKAILTSYKKINSKVSDFKMQFCSSYDNKFSINYNYEIGELKDKMSFTLVDETLKCKEDGEIIKLS